MKYGPELGVTVLTRHNSFIERISMDAFVFLIGVIILYAIWHWWIFYNINIFSLKSIRKYLNSISEYETTSLLFDISFTLSLIVVLLPILTSIIIDFCIGIILWSIIIMINIEDIDFKSKIKSYIFKMIKSYHDEYTKKQNEIEL